MASRTPSVPRREGAPTKAVSAIRAKIRVTLIRLLARAMGMDPAEARAIASGQRPGETRPLILFGTGYPHKTDASPPVVLLMISGMPWTVYGERPQSPRQPPKSVVRGGGRDVHRPDSA